MSSLHLDPATHTYTLGGVVLPSVSEIIAPLTNYDSIPASVLGFARDRGHAVHKMCELFDRMDLDTNELDPRLVPYLDAWMLFCREHEPFWTSIEVSESHRTLKYAGTPDRRGIVRGKRSLIDIKATAELMATVAVQLSGYDLMEPASEQLLSVRLRPDGKYDLQVHKPVHSTFLSCLNIFNWKRRVKK